MKALSIRQPWAWAILHAGKRVENREWQWAPTWRGTFLIHAAKGLTRAEYASAAMWMQDTMLAGCEETDPSVPGGRIPGCPTLPAQTALRRGCIVGRARLASVGRRIGVGAWADPGALHLVLADVERIVEPMPFKGALGFFEVPDALLAGARWEAAS